MADVELISKTARGSAEKLSVTSIEQTENSISLLEFKPLKEESYAFIFGNEVKGVEQQAINTSDGVIEIPQFGTKHSFNVSVTAGIVLWEAVKLMIND